MVLATRWYDQFASSGLKKSRSESLDTSTKLGDATQSIATLQDAADRLSGQVAEQAARLQGFEDEVAGLTTTARQNNAEITEKRTDIVRQRQHRGSP